MNTLIKTSYGVEVQEDEQSSFTNMQRAKASLGNEGFMKRVH
jgi:hypothetical protein